MSIQSRAAICFEAGQRLIVDTIEVADPGPNEVLIKLAASGVCHSDLNFIEGYLGSKFPSVFGHEGFGHVVKLGKGVRGLSEGDKVIPYVVPECGKCAYCQSGRTNYCTEMTRSFGPKAKTSFSYKQKPIWSMLGLGTFSEYIVVQDDQVVKINQHAPADPTCCIACGVTTGLGAALLTAKVDSGAKVVVFGAGGVGLSTIQGCRIAGASMIILVDTNPDREAIGRQFGATHFINAKTNDVVSEVMGLTGIGADYAFDCAGNARVMKQAMDLLNKGWGKLIGVGAIPLDVPVTISWLDLNGRSWTRSFMGSARRENVAEFVEWFVSGKLNLDNMVSHHLGIEQINDAFDMMKAGTAVRSVIVYD